MTQGDPGHLLPAQAWRAVVAQAEVEAARIAAGHRSAYAPVVHGLGTGALVLDGQVIAGSHGGARKPPTFGVFHTAETPLATGYAASIAQYFQGGPGTSCHYMTDPAETWGVLDDRLVAWHCGTGNTNSIGLEQAGRASMPRAQWLVPAGRAQLSRNAAIMRAARDAYGIGLFWMTDAQLLAAHRREIIGGWSTHDQCRRVLGGTTHTDPAGSGIGPVPTGDGFPFDVQMQLALEGDQPATPTTTTTGDDDVHQTIDPGGAAVIALPPIPTGKSLPLRLAVDDPIGGANVRVAVGWGRDKAGKPLWHPLPELNKADGFIGWVFTAQPYTATLTGADACLSLVNYSKGPLGVWVGSPA